MIRHNNAHRRALEKIASHPRKFGFRNAISVSTEKALYHQGRIIAEPDIVIELKNGEIHIVEYKGNGNSGLIEKARKQLENAKWWYGSYRQDVPPGKIHTHIISGDDDEYRDLLRGNS